MSSSIASGSFTARLTCSQAIWLATSTAASRSGASTAQLSLFSALVIASARVRSFICSAICTSTASMSSGFQLTRKHLPGSCSAWAMRSAAIHAGVAVSSAIVTISLGP